MLIFFIGYLKLHTFMLPMPIAQVITFLNFEMCHICVNIYFTLYLLTYTHKVCIGYTMIYIYIYIPCEWGKC